MSAELSTLRRLVTPRWLLRHALVAALVVTFLALARWQFRRATGGNALSWGYTLEWPLFAAFVVAMWVRTLRDELRSVRPGAPPSPPAPIARPPSPPVRPDDGDQELVAYNRYLAWLAADPDRRPGDYPDEDP